MKIELIEKIWNKYNRKCSYCGEELEYKNMQVDHIPSKYLVGKDDIENYNPSFRQCNFYKGTERIKRPFIVRLAIKYSIISFKLFDGKFYFEKLS